jgi:VIT1/CCC1 family predicted Fe2+/Mn2+ transporter
MAWLAILLLLLAGFYLAVERGQSPTDRMLRWMVIVGAVLMAALIGSGTLR